MALPAVAGNTVFASDLYPLCQPSGNTAKEGYYLNGWSSASGDTISSWVASQSRGAVPVSVSLDTSVDAATSCNTPSTNRSSQYGVHVFTTTTAASTNAFVGGLATFQY